MSAAPGDAAPALLHGGRNAPRSWLATVAGALWICWDDHSGRGAPDPDCWQRVDLPPGALDPRELRAIFLDAGTVIARGGGGEALQLVRGDPALQIVDPGLVAVEPREGLVPVPCGPNGHVPIYSRGRWTWRAAPCSAGASACVAAAALPRLRRPAGPEFFFTIELRARARRDLGDETTEVRASSLVASVGVAFDPARWLGWQFAARELEAARRPRLRELPPPRSSGPLAVQEREAIAAIVCGGSVP